MWCALCASMNRRPWRPDEPLKPSLLLKFSHLGISTPIHHLNPSAFPPAWSFPSRRGSRLRSAGPHQKKQIPIFRIPLELYSYVIEIAWVFAVEKGVPAGDYRIEGKLCTRLATTDMPRPHGRDVPYPRDRRFGRSLRDGIRAGHRFERTWVLVDAGRGRVNLCFGGDTP